MKRFFISTLLVLTLPLSVGMMYVSPVGAVDVLNNVCKNAPTKDDKGNPIPPPSSCQDSNTVQQTGENPLFGPSGILTIATRVIAVIIGFLSVIMVIAAGLRMMMASGDASALQSARASLYHALAGVAVAALAYAIVGYVLSKF